MAWSDVKSFFDKSAAVRAFMFDGIKGFLSSFFLGLGAFLVVAIMTVSVGAGEWVPGNTFDQWIKGVSPGWDGSPVDPLVCPACGVFSALFDMVNVLGMNMYEMVHDIVWILVTFGFAVWLLVRVYREMFEKPEGEGLFMDVVKKVIIISIIGAGIGYLEPGRIREVAKGVVSVTLEPALSMGAGIGNEIIKNPVCDRFPEWFRSNPSAAVREGLIGGGAKESLLCAANSINVVMLSGVTAAKNMVDFSLMNLPNPMALLDLMGGLAMAVVFLVLYVAIMFKFVDIVMTTGILIIFLPLMLAGYAYKETEGFSQKGIESIVSMAVYIIVYCLFLGILYASFIYVGDAYYPAPVDNFTYLFPDFLYPDMGNMAGLADMQKSRAFAACWKENFGSSWFLKGCLKDHGMEFNMPGFGSPDPVGSFLPLMVMAILALVIMGMAKSYAGQAGGYLFSIGGDIKGFAQSSLGYLFGGARKLVGKVIGRPQGELAKDALADAAKSITDKIEGGR